mgnify:CR=1 FL=1
MGEPILISFNALGGHWGGATGCSTPMAPQSVKQVPPEQKVSQSTPPERQGVKAQK